MRRMRGMWLVGRVLVAVLAVVGFVAVAPGGSPASAGSPAPQSSDSGAEVHHDTSQPLRSIPPSRGRGHAHPALHGNSGPSAHSNFSARDTSGGGPQSPAAPGTTANFDGIPANGSAPPDN